MPAKSGSTIAPRPPVHRQALDEFVTGAAAAKTGKSVFPPVSCQRLSINLPKDLHKRLKLHCVEKGEQMTVFIIKAIESSLIEPNKEIK